MSTPQPEPLSDAKPEKGNLGGPCNRTACQHTRASWWNSWTRAWYCPSCARTINREAGVNICIPEEEKSAGGLGAYDPAPSAPSAPPSGTAEDVPHHPLDAVLEALRWCARHPRRLVLMGHEECRALMGERSVLTQALWGSAGEPAVTPREGVAEAWKCKADRSGAGGNTPQDCEWPGCGCDPYADKVIAALEESGALAAAAPAGSGDGRGNGWVPVTERKPAESVGVLVYLPDEGFMVGCYRNSPVFGEEWCLGELRRDVSAATYWTTLPASPAPSEGTTEVTK